MVMSALMKCALLPIHQMCHSDWRQTSAWFKVYETATINDFWRAVHPRVRDSIKFLFDAAAQHDELTPCHQCAEVVKSHFRLINTVFEQAGLNSVNHGRGTVKKISFAPSSVSSSSSSSSSSSDDFSSGDSDGTPLPVVLDVYDNNDDSAETDSELDDDDDSFDPHEFDAISADEEIEDVVPPIKYINKKRGRNQVYSARGRSALVSNEVKEDVSPSNSSDDYQDEEEDDEETKYIAARRSEVHSRLGRSASVKRGCKGGELVLPVYIRRSSFNDTHFDVTFGRPPTRYIHLAELVGKELERFFCGWSMNSFTYDLTKGVCRGPLTFTMSKLGLKRFGYRSAALKAIGGEIVYIEHA